MADILELENAYINSKTISHTGQPLNKFLNGTLCCNDLGTDSEEITDFNNLRPGNSYAWGLGSNILNMPCDAGRCYCIKNYGEFPIQIAFKYNADYIYIRHKWTGSWSSWRTI